VNGRAIPAEEKSAPANADTVAKVVNTRFMRSFIGLSSIGALRILFGPSADPPPGPALPNLSLLEMNYTPGRHIFSVGQV